LSSQPVGWPVNFFFICACDFLIRIGISSAGWLYLLTLNFRKPKTFWILRYSVGGGWCVIQYETGCVGRWGVHSISRGRGEISRPGIVFFFSLQSRISHVTQSYTTKNNFSRIGHQKKRTPMSKKIKKKKFWKNHVIKIVDRRRVTGERWRLFYPPGREQITSQLPNPPKQKRFLFF
jgi:hypothetical protein